MKSTGIVEEWKWEEYGRQNREKWNNGMLEHWKNGVLEYWSDGVLGRRNDGERKIPPGLPLQKGGDRRKGWYQRRGEKEGGIGKAWENWGT